MRQVDAATSPTIPRTHLPIPAAFFAQMQSNQSAVTRIDANDSFSVHDGPSLNAQNQSNNQSIPLPAYLQLCSLPSNRKTQRVQSALDTNHNHQHHYNGMQPHSSHSNTYHQHQSAFANNTAHQVLTSSSIASHPPAPSSSSSPSIAITNPCRVCLAIRLNSNQCAATGAFIPSVYLTSTNLSSAQSINSTAAPNVTISHSAPQDRALSAAPVLQVNERSLSLTGSSGVQSQGPSPLPNRSPTLQRSQSTRRASGRSPITISPPTHSNAYASSLGGDSQLESPTTAYLDNNDSVNIFAKYQTPSSSAVLSSAPFANHFLNSEKHHGCFRRSVPTMPLLLAIILCIINWFIPGAGTLLSSLAILCGCKTEYGRDHWKTAFVVCVLAALLQFVTAIFVIGWVWSIMWGVNFIKNSTKKRNKRYLTELENGIRQL